MKDFKELNEKELNSVSGGVNTEVEEDLDKVADKTDIPCNIPQAKTHRVEPR